MQSNVMLDNNFVPTDWHIQKELPIIFKGIPEKRII